MNSIYRKTLFSAIAGAGLAGSVSAIPKLQLDVLGGTWVGGSDETTYSTSNPFTLRALIDPSLVGRAFYLSAAIVPNQDVTPTNFGSFSIDSTQYNASVGMQYGTPPLDVALNDLQTHGIFPTWYAEQSFFAGAGTVASYNVQDDSPGPGLLNYVDFKVDISGLTGYFENVNGTYTSPLAGVHFDLYTYDSEGTSIDYFAPFSHDAQSGDHGTTVSVPDGGTTLLLLGSAMTSLAWLRRKWVVKIS